MYQYSLTWFVDHLMSAIDNTDKIDDIQQRIKDLKNYFTFFIYTKLCRSLQEKVTNENIELETIIHKMNISKFFPKQEKIVFSTFLAKNISIAEKHTTIEEWNCLLSIIEMDNCEEDLENKPNWIWKKTWSAIKRW